MGHRIWIGDLPQSVRGSRAAARRELAACVINTCEELRAKQLKVAPKSTIICSPFQDAQWVARRVARAGYSAQPVKQATYLGVDMGGGQTDGPRDEGQEGRQTQGHEWQGAS
eukprot:7936692-Pyramimonas_sp.AAC.1